MNRTTSLILPLCLALFACDAISDDDPVDETGVEETGDTEDTGDTGDTGDTEDDAFVFATEDASAYTRVDRAGMPAINTAVVTSKDAYNQADPTDDAAGTFAPEILANLAALHAALDDDLTSLGLTPCTVNGDGTGTCVAVAGPLVIPDTLKIDPASTSGFPNGRTLPDPVMDITLAVVLLDLVSGAHSAVDLVGVNPTANDLAFDPNFPYLAAPH